MTASEGAGSFQRQLTEIVRELQARLTDAEIAADEDVSANADLLTTGVVSPRAGLPSRLVSRVEPAISAALAGDGLGGGEGEPDEVSTGKPSRVETYTAMVASVQDLTNETSAGSLHGAPATGDRDVALTERPTGKERPNAHPAGTTRRSREAMWAYWEECRSHRRAVTGADLDRKFGIDYYGRRVVND